MLPIIFGPEPVHINIFCASVRLSGYMGEELFLRRKVAIDTLDLDTILVVSVIGKLPRLIRFIHGMTIAAAVFGGGKRFHSSTDGNVTEDCKQQPC